jgi:hypothetical protein
MARPRSEDPRTEIERFRVTPGERARIAERAATAGLKVPEFLRRRALGLRLNGIPERTPVPKAAVARVVSPRAVEREEVAAEVEEAKMGDQESHEAFVDRRALQLHGQGRTMRVARALAEAEWQRRGTGAA